MQPAKTTSKRRVTLPNLVVSILAFFLIVIPIIAGIVNVIKGGSSYPNTSQIAVVTLNEAFALCIEGCDENYFEEVGGTVLYMNENCDGQFGKGRPIIRPIHQNTETGGICSLLFYFKSP